MSLAIVGAGLSGLAAAYALKDAPLEVAVLEKSRGVSGRAATRRRGEVCYDHGANYFRAKGERMQHLVQEELDSDDLVQIEGDVWTFDGAGQVSEGDPQKNAEARWTYRDGISRLGKLLAEAAGAAPSFDLQLETRVTLLARTGAGWTLTDADGGEHGPFDAVLLTAPAPQSAALLKASRFDDALQEHLVAALAPATYRTQLTLVLAYRRRVERARACYALLNTDGAHDVAWLGFEEAKPGHLPDTGPRSLLVAQMAPAWSRPRFRSALGALVPEVTAQVGSLLDQDVSRPRWADKQGWRYALPTAAADTDALADGAQAGLFFSGDAMQGRGRVAQAVEAGLESGERLRQFFEARKR